MCWKLTEASHETSILRLQNLEVPTKTRRKTTILKLQSVKIGGSLAQNARFSAPTRLVSSLWFSGGVAVSMGEAAKPLLFEGFQAGCHVVFCVASAALCDIPTCLLTCLKCKKRRKSRTKCSLLLHPRVSSRASGFPMAKPCLWGKLRTPHSTLYTPHSTIYTLDSTLDTSHSTPHTLHFTLLTPHSRLYTPHFTLHTPHSTLYTLHFTLYTLHSKLDILHSRLYTLHSSLHTLHSTFHTQQFTL